MSVPQLRFKEFSEEWVSTKISAVFSERNERGNSDMELLSVTMNEGVKRRSDIVGKDNSSENKANYKTVLSGDMVYNSMRMWQGANGISPWDGIVSPAYTILCPKRELAPGFIGSLFKTYNLISKFRRFSQGLTSDTWNLKYPQIGDIKIFIPTLLEQEKIAEFLSTVDEKINSQQSIVASLEAQKKSYMKKIFSQELHFKDENSDEFPKWEKKKLGKIISQIASGTSVNSEDVPVKENEIGVLKTSCVYNNIFNLLQNKKVVVGERTRVSCPVEKNTLIVSRMNTPDLVGACGFVLEDNFNIFLPDRLWKVSFCQQVCSQFVYFLLISPNYRTIVTAKATGTSNSMKNITQDDFKMLVVSLPSLPEQEKIANFFAAYDEKIDAEKQILNHWKTIKKALLQQMFV